MFDAKVLQSVDFLVRRLDLIDLWARKSARTAETAGMSEGGDGCTPRRDDQNDGHEDGSSNANQTQEQVSIRDRLESGTPLSSGTVELLSSDVESIIERELECALLLYTAVALLNKVGADSHRRLFQKTPYYYDT